LRIKRGDWEWESDDFGLILTIWTVFFGVTWSAVVIIYTLRLAGG